MDRLLRGIPTKIFLLLCVVVYMRPNCKAAQHTTRGYKWEKLQNDNDTLLLPEIFSLTAWSTVPCAGSCANTPGCDVVLFNLSTQHCTGYALAPGPNSQVIIQGPTTTVGELSSKDTVALKGTPYVLLEYAEVNRNLNLWLYTSPTMETRYNASKTCTEGGGRLVELEYYEKFVEVFVYITIEINSDDMVWIGGEKMEQGGWQWSNGVDIDVTEVETGNVTCLAMSAGKLYRSFLCDNKFDFICERI